MEYCGILKKAMAVHDRVVDFFAFLASLIITAMIGVLFYEVFMRYVIRRPPPWAWEICECMLLLITFLGAAWLLRRKGHVSVDIVCSRLHKKTRTVVGALTSILGMVICLLITWAGILITIDHYRAGITLPGYLDLQKAPFLVFIPLGCFMLTIEFLRQAIQHLTELQNPKLKG
jgi:TRAP-type C4-dicarboxylate transport system permease small subunit